MASNSMVQTFLVTCILGLCLSRRVDVQQVLQAETTETTETNQCTAGALYRFDAAGKCRTDINNNGVLDRFADRECCEAGMIAPPMVVIEAEIEAEKKLQKERDDVQAAIAEKEQLMREMEQKKEQFEQLMMGMEQKKAQLEQLMREMEQKIPEQKAKIAEQQAKIAEQKVKVEEQRAELPRAEERARLWNALVVKIQEFYDDCEEFKNQAPTMDVKGISGRAQAVILKYHTLSKNYRDFSAGFPAAKKTMKTAMKEIMDEGNRKTNQIDDRLCELMHCSMPMSGEQQKRKIRQWIQSWNAAARAKVGM